MLSFLPNRRLMFRAAMSILLVLGFLPQAYAHSASKSILVLGDSLSAEYGLSRGQGWVSLLEKKLADSSMNTTVINASISGETTSGGRVRLPALVNRIKPDIVIIELGGNDALRGLSVAASEENFRTMITAAKKAKIRLVPFLLEGIADRDDLFQADKIHPIPSANPLILNNVWPQLTPLLKK